MDKVLFICSANVFRSLTAELAVRRELTSDSGITVESAGIFFKQAKPLREDVVTALSAHGLDPQHHVPRELTAEILADCSLVVAMGEDHRIALRERFNVDSLLFNELAIGEATSVKDLIEVVPKFWEAPEEAREYVERTVEYIATNAGNVARAIPRVLHPSLQPEEQAAPSRRQDRQP